MQYLDVPERIQYQNSQAYYIQVSRKKRYW